MAAIPSASGSGGSAPGTVPAAPGPWGLLSPLEVPQASRPSCVCLCFVERVGLCLIGVWLSDCNPEPCFDVKFPTCLPHGGYVL